MKFKYTEEEKIKMEVFGQAALNSLNAGVMKSVERGERWEKIYAIERTKWPYGMGSKLRDEISKELYPILDECITKSSQIARDACQTVKLTEAYLKKNVK